MTTTTMKSTRQLRILYHACKSINHDTKCIMPPINPNVKSASELRQEINKCLNYIERPYHSYLDYVANKHSSSSHYERPYYYINTDIGTYKNIHDICFWPIKKNPPKKDPPNNDPPPASDAMDVPPKFPPVIPEPVILYIEDDEEEFEYMVYTQ